MIKDFRGSLDYRPLTTADVVSYIHLPFTFSPLKMGVKDYFKLKAELKASNTFPPMFLSLAGARIFSCASFQPSSMAAVG